MPANLVNANHSNQGQPAKLTQGPRTNSDMSYGTPGLIRGANMKPHLINATWTDGNAFPYPGSTIDIDFLNNRSYFNSTGIGGAMDFLNFSRASLGTYFGPDGLLKTTPSAALPRQFENTSGTIGTINWLLYSNTFSNATYWINTYTTISGTLVTDPFSGTSAYQLIENNSNTSHYLSQTVVLPVGVFTYSVYCKPISNNLDPWVQLNVFATNSVNGSYNFNILTGEIGYGGNTTANPTIPAVIPNVTVSNNGYYRCSITFINQQAGSVSVRIYPSKTNALQIGGIPAYQGDGVSGTCIYGAQIENGTINNTGYRLDYSNQQYYGNLLVNTQNIGASPWGGSNYTPTQNTVAVTDPFGGNTATLITATATSSSIGPNYAFGGTQVYVSLNSPYTFSIYLQAGTTSWVCLQMYQTKGPSAYQLCYQWFQLTGSGVVGGNSGSNLNPTSATISQVGTSNWYRCVMTRSTNIQKIADYSQQFIVAAYPCNANNSLSLTSGATMYMYGPQFEAGTTATTYKSNVQQTFSLPVGANSTMNGLLSEPASTNYVLWNRDATNAAWSNTNITPLLNQTGIDGVANSASQLTATANNAILSQSFTHASAGRISSVYLKRISGTGAVQITVDGTNWNTVNLENGLWNRGVVTAQTLPNSVFGIRITTSGDSVAMDYAQLENAPNGTMASFPIYTASSSVTRAADICSRVDSLPYNGNQGTVYYKGIYYTNGSITGGKSMTTITGSKSGDSISTFTYNSTTGSSASQKGSGRARNIPYNVNSYNGPTIPTCIALSYNNNKLNTVSDGGVTPNLVPSGQNYTCDFENVDGSPFLNLDTFWVGASGGGSGSFIQRLTYIPIYTPIEGLAQLTKNPQLQINGF